MTMQAPLRVMVVARLFAGLADSLESGHWRPRGATAVYKLLEALADDPSIELIPVFAAKDAETGARFAGCHELHVPRLGGTAHILPYRHRPWLARLRLDGKLREFRHAIRCLFLYRHHRPRVSYFTNANFVVAGLFAHLGLGAVVLRFLGLHPEQKRIADGGSAIQAWFYRGPFDHVVCTLEGSGAPYYLPRLLRRGQPTSILLNGIDRKRPTAQAVDSVRQQYGLGARPAVLFVGRLEWNKGCREFVDALVTLLARRTDSVDALILGHGSLQPELTARIEAAGLGVRIRLTGAVPHDDVPAYLDAADIYVSLNRFGNLSNANLEAIAAGKCLVVLDRDPVSHVDEETEEVLPRDIVARVSRDECVAGLVDVLEGLLDDPARMESCAARTAALGDDLLEGWQVRTEREIEIIRSAAGKSLPPVIARARAAE